MSRALPKRTDHDDATDAELARWPGVTWTRTLRGKRAVAHQVRSSACR